MISYEELTTKHEFDPEAVKEAIGRLEEGDGLLLYCNHMMDSSLFGRQHLVICGPTRSIKSADEAPKWIDPDNCGGLPSRREQLVGEIDVEDVREKFGEDV